MELAHPQHFQATQCKLHHRVHYTLCSLGKIFGTVSATCKLYRKQREHIPEQRHSLFSHEHSDTAALVLLLVSVKDILHMCSFPSFTCTYRGKHCEARWCIDLMPRNLYCVPPSILRGQHPSCLWLRESSSKKHAQSQGWHYRYDETYVDLVCGNTMFSMLSGGNNTLHNNADKSLSSGQWKAPAFFFVCVCAPPAGTWVSPLLRSYWRD